MRPQRRLISQTLINVQKICMFSQTWIRLNGANDVFSHMYDCGRSLWLRWIEEIVRMKLNGAEWHGWGKTVVVVGKAELNKSGPGTTEQQGLISKMAVSCWQMAAHHRIKRCFYFPIKFWYLFSFGFGLLIYLYIFTDVKATYTSTDSFPTAARSFECVFETFIHVKPAVEETHAGG